jgi:hypothetical protein
MMHYTVDLLFVSAFLFSPVVGDAATSSLRPNLRGTLPGVTAESIASSFGVPAAQRLLLDDLNDTVSSYDLAELQQQGGTVISTVAVVEELTDVSGILADESNATALNLASQWGIPHHPIARHYVCKAIFGNGHRFLRHACWWAGDAQSTLLLVDEDLNESQLFDALSQMQQTGGVENASGLEEASDAVSPQLSSQWGIPNHPIARHYVCKAIFGKDHRFLRRACWWAGATQSTVFLVDEDLNYTSLSHVLSQMQQAAESRNASNISEESSLSAPTLTNQWGIPKHPIARHYVCKAIFGSGHRFLRHACWWAGGARSTLVSNGEDMNEKNLSHLIVVKQQTEEVRNGGDRADALNSTFPILTSQWGIPRHPIARHYVCKAIFGHNHRFLRHACWWSGR